MGTRSTGQNRKKGLAALLFTLVAGMAMVPQMAQPTRAGGWACRGHHLRPGASIQRAINLKPTGATFCLHRGTYRISAPLRPKDGQRFIGQKGAALSGARRVRSWSRSGRLWVASGQTQESDHNRGNCSDLSTTICRYPEQLFLNGKNLRQVSTQAAVRPGRFFFDYAANKIFIANNPNWKEARNQHRLCRFPRRAIGDPGGCSKAAADRTVRQPVGNRRDRIWSRVAGDAEQHRAQCRHWHMCHGRKSDPEEPCPPQRADGVMRQGIRRPRDPQ